MTLQELLQKKGGLVKSMRTVLDSAKADKRDLTAEENVQYQSLEADLEKVDGEIAAEQAKQQAAAREQRLTSLEDSLRQPVNPGNLHARGDVDAAPDRRGVCERLAELMDGGLTRKQALQAIATAGVTVEVQRARARAYRQFFQNGYIDPVLRQQAALQMDSDTAGGYLLAPEQFIARLIMDLDNQVFMRSISTVMTLTGAESIGAPTLDTDIGDVEWTTELATGSADTSMAFGKRTLRPHPLARRILVSKDLLRSSAVAVEPLVRERLSYKFGTVEEYAFLQGTGAQSPLGVFTASAQGITTTQDVSTGNSTTAFTTDGLIECKYKLSAAHLASPNLRWIFNPEAIKNLRKLKDGDGQYVWQPGIVIDQPDRLLGVPIVVSEYAPHVFTASLYVGIIGNFTYYWIVDSMAVTIQRLVELYSLTNQDAFIGRMACDGAPVLSTAFARVKLAAS